MASPNNHDLALHIEVLIMSKVPESMYSPPMDGIESTRVKDIWQVSIHEGIELSSKWTFFVQADSESEADQKIRDILRVRGKSQFQYQFRKLTVYDVKSNE